MALLNKHYGSHIRLVSSLQRAHRTLLLKAPIGLNQAVDPPSCDSHPLSLSLTQTSPKPGCSQADGPQDALPTPSTQTCRLFTPRLLTPWCIADRRGLHRGVGTVCGDGALEVPRKREFDWGVSVRVEGVSWHCGGQHGQGPMHLSGYDPTLA